MGTANVLTSTFSCDQYQHHDGASDNGNEVFVHVIMAMDAGDDDGDVMRWMLVTMVLVILMVVMQTFMW